MKCEPILLQTVRQMYVEDIILSTCSGLPEPNHPDIEDFIKDYCEEKVQMVLDKAEDARSGHPKQPTIPLIRLRVI